MHVSTTIGEVPQRGLVEKTRVGWLTGTGSLHDSSNHLEGRMLQRVDRTLCTLQNTTAAVYTNLSRMRRAVRAYHAKRHHWDRRDEQFFEQVLRIERFADRMMLFEQICRDKRVLHVGCVDWPIFRAETNLHLKLAGIAATLAGLDSDAVGLETLRTYFPGDYYASVAAVKGSFDVLLVPEVLEHVPNAASFLQDLDQLDFTTIVITAPNALSGPPHEVWDGSYYDDGELVEIVHPDHKCYYSPYTLQNVVREATTWRAERVGTLAKSAFIVAGK